MIKEAIIKLVGKGDLTYEEARTVMLEIMGGKTTPTQNAALQLFLQRARKQRPLMKSPAVPKHAKPGNSGPPSGDGSPRDCWNRRGRGPFLQYFNDVSHGSCCRRRESSKHGNRAASSLCGTADCLEALGVKIDMTAEKALSMLQKTNFCFLFAQKYHSAMKYVGPIRKELGFRTVFNILGPLTNPAKPEMFLLGVYDEYLVEPIAKVLASLGVRRGIVAYGREKLDEISPNGPTVICEIRDGYYRSSLIRPEDFGLVPGTKKDLLGGTPEENARVTRDILSGRIGGTKRNAVLLNAGAAFFVAQKAESIKEGITLAASLINSGKALTALENIIKESQQ